MLVLVLVLFDNRDGGGGGEGRARRLSRKEGSKMRYFADRPAQGFGTVDKSTVQNGNIGYSPEALRNRWIDKTAQVLVNGVPMGREMAAMLWAERFGKQS